MDNLIEKMKVYLASNFAFYLKLHFFHWNVEGPNFPQYHEFFEEAYQQFWGLNDDIAEQIRSIQGYAPGSLERFKDLSRIKGQMDPVDAAQMFNLAMADNSEMISLIKEAYDLAESAGEIGLSNFLQDRMIDHKKFGWKLRSTAKVQ